MFHDDGDSMKNVSQAEPVSKLCSLQQHLPGSLLVAMDVGN
jgi:hypothetical protein